MATIKLCERPLKLTFSKKDDRHYKLVPHTNNIKLPDEFSLIDIDKIQIYDQGQIGSCTSNALAQCIRIKTQNKTSISRIFNYFNSRLLEGNQYTDSGCCIVDCLKAICKYKWIYSYYVLSRKRYVRYVHLL